MLKQVAISALALLTFATAEARADWRTLISGGTPMLPANFNHEAYDAPLTVHLGDQGAHDTASSWTLPLVDRTLSQAEKSADLAPELRDAILRIEPIYDPTRVDGPNVPVILSVSAGTASMDNVFADHWRRADLDPNVNYSVRYIADAWRQKGVLPCEAFTKTRAYDSAAALSLTALSVEDCRALLVEEARGFEDTGPTPVVPGVLPVPTFAAPLPGARMSSEAFWAAQRARIAVIHARLIWKWGSASPIEAAAVGLNQ